MITKLLLMTLFCCGLKKSTEEHMVFHRIWNWANKNDMPDWLFKPVFGCIFCFASFWGSIVYWTITDLIEHRQINSDSLAEWIILCVCCIITNGIIYSFVKKYEEYLK